MEDLRTWIEKVRELGLLREVRGADWNLEIGAITDMNVKGNKYTLLFDEIKGYPKGFRLLTGAMLDVRRLHYPWPASSEERNGARKDN
jgi:4-hydroxy-3-polyprenylbenzoate decarboxylase